MANLPETAQWEEGIYQLETTDPVEGGESGVDNLQAKLLANRTAYLKQQLEENTAQAKTNKKGTAEIATQSEVDMGTDDLRFVTPKKLKSWLKQASESVFGVLKIATQSQTNQGDSDSVAVSPKKMRLGVSFQPSLNGYIALPEWMGGLILQWGLGQKVIPTEAAGSVFVGFPIVFPSGCLFAACSTKGDDSIFSDVIFQVAYWDSAGIRVFPQWFGTGSQGLCAPLFFAIGH